MQPSKDFTDKADTLSSIVEYSTNTSRSGLESHHLRRHEAEEEDAEPRRGIQDAQCQITLGLDAGILELPRRRFKCVNDWSSGGICRSGEKVSKEGDKCENCFVSGFPVQQAIVLMFSTGPFRVQQLIKL